VKNHICAMSCYGDIHHGKKWGNIEMAKHLQKMSSWESRFQCLHLTCWSHCLYY